MARKSQVDPVLSRGIKCLVAGVLTCWIFGVGLLFIFAAVLCGVVGLFRKNAGKSFLLLIGSLFLGVFCAHVAAVVTIFAYNAWHPDRAIRNSDRLPSASVSEARPATA